jgi:hypothetical protein
MFDNLQHNFDRGYLQSSRNRMENVLENMETGYFF